MNYIPYLLVIFFILTWFFTSLKFASVVISVITIWLARSYPQEFKYFFKMFFFNFMFMFSTLLYLPFFIIHPFSYDNLGYIFIFWKYTLQLLHITVETRDIEKNRVKGPAIIIANHQSSLDLFSLLYTLPPRTTILAKKEILYFGWFGFCAYLCNIIFVDRFNHTKAIDTMNKIVKIIHDNQINVFIYPEGTRSMGNTFLPFKKGAFHLAIQAQVPIIPIVSSSYENFLDHKKKRFDPGKIIAKALEPIDTKGMTSEDVDTLIEKTRNSMLKVYHEVSAEIMHEYTAYDEDSNPTPAKEIPSQPIKTVESHLPGDDGEDKIKKRHVNN